ncbi:MAG: LLM class flavin-dependent oxidoreductase, partial [Candidatus Limnocylindrales bacterium]
MAGIGGIGGRALAVRLGRVGIWNFALQRLTASDEGAAMREYERLGFRAVWMPESLGSKEVFAHASILLAATERAIVAPGIASIYARDPMAMANGARAIAEAYTGRFVLGIGVSHAPSVAMRGGNYGKPVETMSAYLDAMAASSYAGPDGTEPVPLVLAALGPRMLELAASRADGAHPYFVPVEHTPFARA